MGLFEKIKKMNRMKMFKAIALPLVFALACTSLFMGSRSFSKYISEQEEKAQSTLATPNIYYHRGRLTRTSVDKKNFYAYPIKDGTGTLIFEDLRPQDVVEYIFYVSNFNEQGDVNVIPANVTIEVIVSLERMHSDNSIDNKTSYYLVENPLLVGSYPSSEMPKASFNIGKQIESDDKLRVSTNPSDYTAMSRKALLQGDAGDYNNETFFTNNELYVDARSGVYIHRIGLQIPTTNTKFNKAFLLRISLPEQDGEANTYVAGRMHIDVNLIIDQIAEIN